MQQPQKYLPLEEIIRHLKLCPHPEGGYFRESYRSAGHIGSECVPPSIHDQRDYCTSIYFLLPSEAVSKFHKLKSDEIWHFYFGDPLEIVSICKDTINLSTKIMGSDLAQGQHCQAVIPSDTWFGARPHGSPNVGYSLSGCTVAPGFDFADFQLPDYTISEWIKWKNICPDLCHD